MDNKEVVAPNKAKVTLSKQLLDQIEYLHSHCPKATEWSGLLIWKLEKGSLEDLTDVEITADAVFPMDYGDSTFTSFEGNEDWLECFAKYPQINPMKPEPGWYIGKIHSHHNMNVFHSGTDKSDLYENAPKLPMFLSLIVNYKKEYDCELAIAMETEQILVEKVRWKLKGWKKAQKKIDTNKQTIQKTYIMKCDMYVEVEPMDDWFEAQCKKLNDKKIAAVEAAKKIYTPPAHGRGSYGNYNGNYYNNNNSKVEDNTIPPRGFIIKKTADFIVELFSLGELYTDMPLKQALRKIDTDTPCNIREQYIKAVRAYFGEIWYDTTFYNVTTTPEEVIDSIKLIIKDDNCWLSGVLRDAFDGKFKKECRELWPLQESSMV